ncbi:hypothetical protein WAI453_001982 [Rhynchosporium graminicola]
MYPAIPSIRRPRAAFLGWLNIISVTEKTITVLWLGSSLANESQDVVRNVANNFIAALEANSSLAEIQFLVGLDGTKNVSRGHYIGDFVIILSISRNLLPPQLF